MGRKSRTQYTSQGQRRNVVNGKSRISDWTHFQQINHKVEAWMKGKKVWLTVPNPNTNETAKPFVRKLASEVWGKYTPYMMKQS